MVNTKEEVSATEPVSATEQRTKFIWSPKGMILALEIALCFITIICKATSLRCYLWCPIVDLVWAIIIFIIYGMELQIRALPWTDFFRAITGSLTLLITSILCISWAFPSSGEVAGSIFGLLAAAVFGYDTFGIMKYIKELKEQGRDINFILI
ncbi:proteolipid protein 2 [Megalobrama amblycephala]|uniref:proteolipid protein 2 n=1 Tax=Megalobrama amblycephala TaxID=75352 RepID=UPI00201442A1|nr:proteolipid protein 2 [Megalobrama amblycephala]XP_048065458.1 proteolipid protein 2 [Megalobrama amblycephala]XP_048065459.1 proteolipid protein 2 [Megalobrama amblycephala]